MWLITPPVALTRFPWTQTGTLPRPEVTLSKAPPVRAPARRDDFVAPAHVTLELGAHADMQQCLADLHDALHREKARPVDLQGAAELVNRIHGRGGTAIRRLDERELASRVASISQQDLVEFARVAGVVPADFARAMRDWKFGGALESSATLPGSLAGNATSNLCTLLAPHDRVQQYRIGGTVGSGVIQLLMPLMSAVLQIPMSALGDRMRSSVVAVVPDRKSLDGRPTHRGIAADLEVAVERFEAAQDELTRVLKPLESAISAVPAQELSQGDEDRLHRVAQQFSDAIAGLEVELDRAGAKHAADEHQRLGNHYQSYMRWLKSVVPPAVQMLRALGLLSPAAGLAAQIGGSIGTSAGQAVLAGWDEQAKTLYALRVRLLRNPPLTPEGLRRIQAGQAVRPTDIDAAQLASMFRGPLQSRVEEARRVQQDAIAYLQLVLALPATPELQRASAQAELARRQDDLRRLESGDIAALDVTGEAARLLAAPSRVDRLLWKEIAVRYRKAGNLCSQAMKYLGQQWQLVMIGPGFYSLAPKITNAARAGKPPIPLMVAFTVLAGALNILGCKAFAPVAATAGELQFRIESQGGTGWLEQARDAGLMMVAGPLHQRAARRLGDPERRARDALNEGDRLGARLRRVEASAQDNRFFDARESLEEASDEEFHDAVSEAG